MEFRKQEKNTICINSSLEIQSLAYYDIDLHNVVFGNNTYDSSDIMYLHFNRTHEDITVNFGTWLFNTLEHEILHKVLHERIGDTEGTALDNLIIVREKGIPISRKTLEIIRMHDLIGEKNGT
jgi:hypothetical protein